MTPHGSHTGASAEEGMDNNWLKQDTTPFAQRSIAHLQHGATTVVYRPLSPPMGSLKRP